MCTGEIARTSWHVSHTLGWSVGRSVAIVVVVGLMALVWRSGARYFQCVYIACSCERARFLQRRVNLLSGGGVGGVGGGWPLVRRRRRRWPRGVIILRTQRLCRGVVTTLWLRPLLSESGSNIRYTTIIGYGSANTHTQRRIRSVDSGFSRRMDGSSSAKVVTTGSSAERRAAGRSFVICARVCEGMCFFAA